MKVEKELAGIGLAILQVQPRILLVEDDEQVLRLETTIVRRCGYECSTAHNLTEARSELAASSYNIVFLDLTLPDGYGLDLVDWNADPARRPVVTIVTAVSQSQNVVELFRRGAHDLICKPFDIPTFEERLGKAVEEWRSRARYDYYRGNLEQLVKTMMERLIETTSHIDRVYDAAVRALGSAIDLKDPETESHCRRVSENSVILGRSLGLSSSELRNLRWGAYLHDIGKIGVPSHLLTKPGPLTIEEREAMKLHPIRGFQMISKVDFLRDATDPILYHHERYDGKGYPYGLKGERIPIAARIFAAVDAVDAMLNRRSYRKALPFETAMEELKSESGRQFDPDVVGHFLQIPRHAWWTFEDAEGE